MKKLPIGIQTFSRIIEDNCCYVDKTPLIAQLVDQYYFCFFSRPRRFGKTLLIDTIAEAFHGRKDLFKGLYLEKNWDWRQQYAVIRIDFAQGVLTSRAQMETNTMVIIFWRKKFTILLMFCFSSEINCINRIGLKPKPPHF